MSEKGIPVRLEFDPDEVQAEKLEHDHTDECPACHAVVDRLSRELESLHRSDLAMADRILYAIDLAASAIVLSVKPDRFLEASAEYTKMFVERLGTVSIGMGVMTKESIAEQLSFAKTSKRSIGFSKHDDDNDTIRRLERMPPANKKPC